MKAMLSKIPIIFVFASLVGTSYSIVSGVSYADVFCLFLFFNLLYGLVKKQILISKESKLSFLYILMMAFTSVFNQTFFETQFINYFRIIIEGWIVYQTVFFYLKDEKKLNETAVIYLIYILYFVLSSKNMLSASMVYSESFASLDFGYGRNNWGFTNLLLIMSLVYVIAEFSLKISKYFILLIPVMTFYIYFSASRLSLISLGAFIFFFIYWKKSKHNVAIYISIAFLFLCIYLMLPFFSSFIDADILEGSQQVFANKIGKVQEDGFSLRLMKLNILPILDFIEEASFLKLLFGDGLSITHGIFSHIFLSTGLIGFFYFIYYHVKVGTSYWRCSRCTRYVTMIIIVMFVNDFITNARFIIQGNTMLYMFILAFIERSIYIKRLAK